ncbi:hypothetical protein BDW22DRAFT_1428736 [Trametopsis cervina]|nr:hypothetical protein BDW22DRAFT_1428736 [Trametopsis cervina]
MVVLSPNFAILASLSALAAMVMVPANGVAIPNQAHRTHSTSDPRQDSGNKLGPHHNDATSSSSPDGSDSGLPLPIPLPSLGRRHGQESKRWDPFGPLLELGPLYIGDHSEAKAASQAESFATYNQNSHARVASSGGRVKTVHGPNGKEIRLVVTGNNEHIRVARAPEPHHGHEHDRHNHGNIIVSGDNDEVHLHRNDKRDSSHHGQSGRHYHWKKDEATVSLDRRDDGSPSGHESHVSDGFGGVPGVIDIMSNVAGSSTGQRIASLTLAPATNSSNSSAPFVLNASGTNSTQVYLVPLSEDTFNPNSPISPNMPSNSTAPSNSTSSDDSAPQAESVNPSARVGLGGPLSASLSTDSTDTPSNSTAALKKVALQIPVFDPQQAKLIPFCATFDPKPSAPSTMTMQDCSEGAMEEDHQSQVFAYDPSTGIIQPMWFKGEDDGMSGADDGSDSNSAGAADESNDDTVSSPVDASSAPADTGDVDPSTDVGAAVTRLSNLNRQLVGDASNAANFAATKPVSFAEDSGSYNAQNVTLRFTPSVPVLPQVDAPAEQQAVEPTASSSSSDSFATSSATVSGSLSSSTDASMTLSSTETGVSTATDSATTTFAFSPAAVASATPSDSASVSASASASDASGVASSAASSSASSSATDSSSAASVTATDSAVLPTSSAHGLGVEVFDPSATTATDSASATTTDSASLASATDSSSNSTITSIASGSSSSAAASMTPVSTSPYEWMFRKTSAKGN